MNLISLMDSHHIPNVVSSPSRGSAGDSRSEVASSSILTACVSVFQTEQKNQNLPPGRTNHATTKATPSIDDKITNTVCVYLPTVAA